MNGTRADVFCAFVHIKGGTIESENSSSSSKKFQSSTKEHDCRGSTEEWWRAVSSSHGIQRTRLAGRIVLRNHNIMSATEAKQKQYSLGRVELGLKSQAHDTAYIAGAIMWKRFRSRLNFHLEYIVHLPLLPVSACSRTTFCVFYCFFLDFLFRFFFNFFFP